MTEGKKLGGIEGLQLLLGGFLLLFVGFFLFSVLWGAEPRLIIITTTEEFYACLLGALFLVGLGVKIIICSFRVFTGRPVG